MKIEFKLVVDGEEKTICTLETTLDQADLSIVAHGFMSKAYGELLIEAYELEKEIFKKKKSLF